MRRLLSISIILTLLAAPAWSLLCANCFVLRCDSPEVDAQSHESKDSHVAHGSVSLDSVEPEVSSSHCNSMQTESEESESETPGHRLEATPGASASTTLADPELPLSQTDGGVAGRAVPAVSIGTCCDQMSSNSSQARETNPATLNPTGNGSDQLLAEPMSSAWNAQLDAASRTQKAVSPGDVRSQHIVLLNQALLL